MSDNNKFSSGFLLGTIVGGVVGGVIGSVLTNQTKKQSQKVLDKNGFDVDNYSSLNDQESIENARLSLEDKINQLNHAIDDVRVTLLRNNEHQE